MINSNEILVKKKSFSCTICKYRTTRTDLLENHTKSVHSSECRLCDFTSNLPGAVAKHVTDAHKEVKPHACPHCPYRSSRRYNLKSHIKAQHERVKRYKCPHCSQSTSLVNCLESHIKSAHTRVRLHQCPECHFKFPYMKLLLKHILAVHGTIYICHCGYVAKTLNEKNSHTMTEHTYEFSQTLTNLALKTLKLFKPLF